MWAIHTAKTTDVHMNVWVPCVGSACPPVHRNHTQNNSSMQKKSRNVHLPNADVRQTEEHPAETRIKNASK